MRTDQADDARIKTYITMLTGPDAGRRFVVETTASIGRDVTNTLRIPLPTLSRRHAFIFRRANRFFIQDIGSHNGTFVNGNRILEHPLSDGDVIMVGGVEMEFRLPGAKSSGHSVIISHDDKSTFTVGHSSSAPEMTMVLPILSKSPQTDKLQQKYDLIFKVNSAALTIRQLPRLLERILDFIFESFGAERAVILLRNDEDAVTPFAARSRKGRDASVLISQTVVDRVVDEGLGLLILDTSKEDALSKARSVLMMGIRSALCVPLVRQGKVMGAIYMDTLGRKAIFTSDDLETLSLIAAPLAVAIENIRYVDEIERRQSELQRAYDQTISALANAVEARDHYTVGHTWRVTQFALATGRELGLSAEKLDEIQLGGVLHDIGKVGVSDAILRKPAKLTDEEFACMKLHPEIGARMVRDIEFLQPAVLYILCHHEKMDGSGYPQGLKSKAIPFEGRLLAVADMFDALTSDRPYRKSLPTPEAMRIIREASGHHLDPEIAAALENVSSRGEINSVIQNYLANVSSVVCPFCSTYIAISTTAAEGDLFDCPVCHHNVKLLWRANTFVGELQ